MFLIEKQHLMGHHSERRNRMFMANKETKNLIHLSQLGNHHDQAQPLLLQNYPNHFHHHKLSTNKRKTNFICTMTKKIVLYKSKQVAAMLRSSTSNMVSDIRLYIIFIAFTKSQIVLPIADISNSNEIGFSLSFIANIIQRRAPSAFPKSYLSIKHWVTKDYQKRSTERTSNNIE
jgi:hypothetical protein